jgi:hypothetical protein
MNTHCILCGDPISNLNAQWTSRGYTCSSQDCRLAKIAECDRCGKLDDQELLYKRGGMYYCVICCDDFLGHR